MIIEYTGRHIDVTPALKSHAEEQLNKIAHVFDGKATKAHIILEVERGRHRAEVNINWRIEALTATASSADMYQSISQAVGKIEKQALKVKKKVIDKSHKARRVSSLLEARGLGDAEMWEYGDSPDDDALLASADHPLRVDGVRIVPDP